MEGAIYDRSLACKVGARNMLIILYLFLFGVKTIFPWDTFVELKLIRSKKSIFAEK